MSFPSLYLEFPSFLLIQIFVCNIFSKTSRLYLQAFFLLIQILYYICLFNRFLCLFLAYISNFLLSFSYKSYLISFQSLLGYIYRPCMIPEMSHFKNERRNACLARVFSPFLHIYKISRLPFSISLDILSHKMPTNQFFLHSYLKWILPRMMPNRL